MASDPLTELPALLDWLKETIEPMEGQHWQITLNSNGAIVDATAKVVQSKDTNDRGHTMTISRVVEAKFRLGRSPQRRTMYRVE